MTNPADWPPFMHVDPSMTNDVGKRIGDLEKWLAEHYVEGKHFRRRVAGVYVEFYAHPDLHAEMTQKYVQHRIDAAGGEDKFNEQEGFKYPQSYSRNVLNQEHPQIRPTRNPGKTDKHKRS